MRGGPPGIGRTLPGIGCAPGPSGPRARRGRTERRRLLGDDRSGHLVVDVTAEEIRPLVERRDLLVRRLRTDDLADRDLLRGARVLVDRDVVGRRILVVEREAERLAGLHRQRRRRERVALGRDDRRVRIDRTGGCRLAARRRGTGRGDGDYDQEAETEDRALHLSGSLRSATGRGVDDGQAPAEPVAGRRPNRAPSSASSLLTTLIGLPSMRAKSIARRTISETSIALAM